MTKEIILAKMRFRPLKQQAYLQLLVNRTGFTFVNMVTKTLLYDLSQLTEIMYQKIAENQNHKTLLVSYLLL